jgi:hypothetical protein
MALNPRIWYPIAVGATVLNLVSAAVYTGAHAGVHAALALGFGLWAQRLRQRAASGEQLQVEAGTTQQLQEGFEALEAEVTRLRQELSETQERVDFVERVLAQSQEAGRLRK